MTTVFCAMTVIVCGLSVVPIMPPGPCPFLIQFVSMNMSLHCSLSIPAAWCSDCCYILVISYEVFRCMWRPSWIFRPGNGSPSATNVVFVVVLVVISTKAFSIHNQSLSNFANTLATALSTIALCRIFKLSRN